MSSDLQGIRAEPATRLALGGEMGRMIAAHPWSETSFGPEGKWPAHLRAMVNLMLGSAAPMAVVWGGEYRLLYNDAYREIIKDKHPKALGERCEVIFSEVWSQLRPLFEQVYRGESVTLEDIAVELTRGGETKEANFSGSYSPLRNEAGAVDGFLAMVQECTARLQAERERAKIFDTTLSAIVDFAYSFDRAGRFRYVNKALLDLWGIKLEDAVGKNFHELNYPPELADRLQAQIEDVFREKKVVCDETRYVSPAGVEGCYEYIFSPVVGAGGAVELVAGSTRDITERKRLEQRLEKAIADLRGTQLALEKQTGELERQVKERTARLQETVSELETFSYSISHDLRGPLRTMRSFAEALREDCGAAVGPAGEDYIRRIVGASTRLDRIIQDVLVYSRVARTELKLEQVELDGFVRGIVESHPALHGKQAEITVQGALPAVQASPAALTQCFTNLIGNALKFVEKGTRPAVRISAEVIDGRAYVSVSDNGIGIPQKAQEAIFNVFYRHEAGYEGTGIGLAIVRKAIERLGGRVTVISEPGRGSTFTFDLSLAETP